MSHRPLTNTSSLKITAAYCTGLAGMARVSFLQCCSIATLVSAICMESPPHTLAFFNKVDAFYIVTYSMIYKNEEDGQWTQTVFFLQNYIIIDVCHL